MLDQDLLNDFIVEAAGLVNTVEEGLLLLEQGRGGSEAINEIFRALHSIKGSAGFFSLSNIVNLSHAMENFFDEVRHQRATVQGKIVDTMLEANDCLKQMINDVHKSEQRDISLYLERIASLFHVESSAEDCGLSPGEGCADPAAFISSARQRGLNIFRVDQAAFPGEGPDRDGLSARIREDIKSIGSLVCTSAAVDHTSAEGAVFPGFVILTTVLEKNLLALALDLPEKYISEITAPSQLPPAESFSTGDDTPAYAQESGVLLPESSSSSGTEAVDGLEHAVQGPAERHAPEMAAAGSPVDAPALTGKETIPFDISQQEVEAEPQQGPGGAAFSEDSVRVNVNLLNDLLNLASEMVLGRNQLLRLLAASRKSIPGLNVVLQNIDGITTELQEKIMLTRMQPMARVFNRFPRFVRELSKKTGKTVNLIVKGQDVELDKSIVEGLYDPLTHLVRNSVDHGLEKPALRELSGKAAVGTISLHAYHEGGHVVIDVMDDGAGIDLEIIKAKALEKGLFTPEEIDSMNDQELHALLFKAGFSLTREVTDLSGRGVGLDVVRTNVEKLGGVLEIMSILGEGTTFRLTMPLTLAIIPSLIVEASGQKFALPQVNLQEMVRVKHSDPTRRIEVVGGARVLHLRDKYLPVVHLKEVLGLHEENAGEIPRRRQESAPLQRVLIIKSGSKRFGLIVDRIHDGEEILVKQLPVYLKSAACYSGVTILGDGSIAMILDPEGTANKAGLKFSNENTGQLLPRLEQPVVQKEEQSLLLFKCSGPEVFCMDLSMVTRVEKIESSRLEKIGEKEFIQFDGESLRVIRPEDYFPVTKGPADAEHYYVIIPRLVKYPMGLLIENIIDTQEADILFDRDNLQAKGIMGTAILSGQITLVINLFELFEMAAPELYAPQVEPNTNLAEKRVLLVEDTPFFLKLERQYLESAGYTVITALNGREAWELLQEEEVDLVVSDIEMPLMNGYELVKKIKSDQALSNLPVIAVTSKAEPESIDRGMEAGFDYYEIKLNKEMLLEKIAKALSG